MTSAFRMGLCAVVLSSGLAFAQQTPSPTPQQSDPLAPCPPVQPPVGGGGAGAEEPQLVPPEVGAQQMEPQELEPQGEQPEAFAVEDEEEEAIQLEEEGRADEGGADRGLYVQLGGGAEGYTGALAPAINPGPAAGATVGLRPWRQVGIEVGYSGAVNDIDLGRGEMAGGAGQGADLMRQGGQGAIIVDLSPTRFQPYVMGGLGIERYDVRNGERLGFQDETHGYVPAGAGFRYQFGRTVHADLRGNYNFLVGDDFSPVPGTSALDGRLQATLMAGGTF